MAEQSEFAKRCAWLMSTERMKLGPMESLVLYALHGYANEDNECWPKSSVLTHVTGMSYRQLHKSFNKLEQLDLLQRRRARTSNLRLFVLTLECTTDPVKCTTDPEGPTCTVCTTDPLVCTTDPVQCTTDPVQCTTDPPPTTLKELSKNCSRTVQELSSAAAWESIGFDYQEDTCIPDTYVTRQPVTSLTKSSVAATTPKPPPSVACEIGDSAQLKSIGGQRYRASGSRSKRLDTKDLDAKVDKLISVYPSPSTNRSLAVKHLQTALTGKPFDKILAAATAHGAARDPQYLTGLHNWLSGSMFDNPVAARKKGLGDPIHMTVDFGRNLRNAS